jgi:hypothetical protein
VRSVEEVDATGFAMAVSVFTGSVGNAKDMAESRSGWWSHRWNVTLLRLGRWTVTLRRWVDPKDAWTGGLVPVPG